MHMHTHHAQHINSPHSTLTIAAHKPEPKLKPTPKPKSKSMKNTTPTTHMGSLTNPPGP